MAPMSVIFSHIQLPPCASNACQKVGRCTACDRKVHPPVRTVTPSKVLGDIGWASTGTPLRGIQSVSPTLEKAPPALVVLIVTRV